MSRSPTRSVLSALSAGLLALAGLAISGTPAHAATLNLTQYVNPFIGTDDSNAPNPVGGGAGGSTVPGPIQPFGMVQLSPDTPTASPSGYRFGDSQIDEFSLTHFNGAGCSNNEDLGILPGVRLATEKGGHVYEQTWRKPAVTVIAQEASSIKGAPNESLPEGDWKSLMRSLAQLFANLGELPGGRVK